MTTSRTTADETVVEPGSESTATATCLVRGSINIDEFFHLPHIVRGGETISSTEFSRRAGGKGANQACAVARSLSSDSAAGKVELKGAVGADGVWVRDLLEGYGVGVDGVQVRGGESTGRAIIQLDAKGENSIILHAGTNHADLPLPSTRLPYPNTTHLLLQNEIPLAQTLHYLSLCASSSQPSQPSTCAIFNPSPMPSASEIASFPWSSLSWLIVNEGEIADLLAALPSDPFLAPKRKQAEAVPDDAGRVEGEEEEGWVEDEVAIAGESITIKRSAQKAISVLFKLLRHPAFRRPNSSALSSSPQTPSVILTLGPEGSWALLPPSDKVPHCTAIYTSALELEGEVRDTTGAGDCFAGYFAGGLMRMEKDGKLEGGKEIDGLVDVLRTATVAAGMCVERHGAQEAVPILDDVLARKRAAKR